MGMGGTNAGPFFWRSGADTRTCSNINNCVTQNLPRPIPTSLTSPPVPPGFVPLHRAYLSYDQQCEHSTCGKPTYVAPPSKKVQFNLPTLHRDKDSRCFRETRRSNQDTRCKQEPVSNTYHHVPSLSLKYAYAANELLANIQIPTNQPAPNMLLSTYNVNRENIK